ncbi:uncharacterized protein LOC130054382 isoform X2 [Ostrea edulis]|nr:uncharacterized protein LOC130054382 isoform X2 [Ostrea edulis]
MLEDLEKKFLNRFQVTDEKLDTLTRRVFSLEKKINDDYRKRVPNSGAKCHHCPTTTFGRNRPLKRSAAIWHSEDDLDTSSSDGSFSIKMEDLPSACANVYKDVLVQEHENILNDVDLNNTDILDRLVTEDALTSSDIEDIQRQGGRRDQTRSLLLKLEQRGHDTFLSFVDAIERDYNYLHTSLKRSLSIMCKEKKDGRIQCTVCRIIENVHPRVIIDKCYHQKIITAKVLNDINQCGDPRQGWEQLKPQIKNGEAIGVLADSLLPKFKSLSCELRKMKDMSRLVCFCKRLSAKRKLEEANKQKQVPASPVEHSYNPFLNERDTGSDDSSWYVKTDPGNVLGSVEYLGRFGDTGFRERFHRQAIKKKDLKGKHQEQK